MLLHSTEAILAEDAYRRDRLAAAIGPAAIPTAAARARSRRRAARLATTVRRLRAA